MVHGARFQVAWVRSLIQTLPNVEGHDIQEANIRNPTDCKNQEEKATEGVTIDMLRSPSMNKGLKGQNLFGGKHSRLFQGRALLLALPDEPLHPKMPGNVKFRENSQKTWIKKFIVCVASKTADLLPALSSSVRYGMTTSSVRGNKKHLRRLAKASICEVRRALLSKVALDFPPRIVCIPDSVSDAPAWHSHLPDSDPCQL